MNFSTIPLPTTAAAAAAATNHHPQARLESRLLQSGRLGHHRRQHNHEKADRVTAFWTAFGSRRGEWTKRLLQVTKDHRDDKNVDNDERDEKNIAVESEMHSSHNNSRMSFSESEKRRVHLELTQLTQDLKEFRTQCLSSSSSSATTPFIPNSYPLLPVVSVEWLSATDVRRLHRELTACQSALDDAWHELLPKGKFLFARFRRAWQEKQQRHYHQQQDEKNESNVALVFDQRSNIGFEIDASTTNLYGWNVNSTDSAPCLPKEPDQQQNNAELSSTNSSSSRIAIENRSHTTLRVHANGRIETLLASGEMPIPGLPLCVGVASAVWSLNSQKDDPTTNNEDHPENHDSTTHPKMLVLRNLSHCSVSLYVSCCKLRTTSPPCLPLNQTFFLFPKKDTGTTNHSM